MWSVSRRLCARQRSASRFGGCSAGDFSVLENGHERPLVAFAPIELPASSLRRRAQGRRGCGMRRGTSSATAARTPAAWLSLRSTGRRSFLYDQAAGAADCPRRRRWARPHGRRGRGLHQAQRRRRHSRKGSPRDRCAACAPRSISHLPSRSLTLSQTGQDHRPGWIRHDRRRVPLWDMYARGADGTRDRPCAPCRNGRRSCCSSAPTSAPSTRCGQPSRLRRTFREPSRTPYSIDPGMAPIVLARLRDRPPGVRARDGRSQRDRARARSGWSSTPRRTTPLGPKRIRERLDSLPVIADMTGGRTVPEHQRAGEPTWRQFSRRAAAYYVLGFTPAPPVSARDATRRIEVRVRPRRRHACERAGASTPSPSSRHRVGAGSGEILTRAATWPRCCRQRGVPLEVSAVPIDRG